MGQRKAFGVNGQCTATSKQHHRRCRQPALANGVCYYHGGPSTGPKTLKAGGKFSKHIPVRLAARYQESISDPELASMRHEIAFVDSLVCEAMDDMNPLAAQEQWGDALMALGHAYEVADPEDAIEVSKSSLDQLGEILTNGRGDAAKKAEVLRLFEQRRRLSDTEIKRLSVLNLTMTVEQSMALARNLIRGVFEICSIPEERVRLGRFIGELYSVPDKPGSGSVRAN